MMIFYYFDTVFTQKCYFYHLSDEPYVVQKPRFKLCKGKPYHDMKAFEPKSVDFDYT